MTIAQLGILTALLAGCCPLAPNCPDPIDLRQPLGLSVDDVLGTGVDDWLNAWTVRQLNEAIAQVGGRFAEGGYPVVHVRLSADENCTSRDAAGYVLGNDRDTIWLCSRSRQSTYEWTQAVKHELGHVLGAYHMPCDTQAVMGASQACAFKRSFDSVTYNIADYVTICNNGRTTGGICDGLFPLR